MDTLRNDWPAPTAMMDAGRRFLARAATGGPVALACHGDVDGLTAAVLVRRAVERLGGRALVLPAGKGEHAHRPEMQARIRAATPAALVVLDMGSRRGAIVAGLPTLILDHHVPDGLPEGALVVSAHGAKPEVATGLLSFHLLRPLVDIEDLDWLALLAAVADLGVERLLPELRPLLRRYGRKNVSEAVALLNAARRAGAYQAELALAVLEAARVPADIALGRVAGVEALRTCRAEVAAELARWARVAPRFAGEVALVRIGSAAQIHPLLAVRWAQRLRGQIVLVANDDYLPGRVNFALRTTGQRDLIAFLRGLGLGAVEGEFAQGHPGATGGSVPPAEFARLLAALGFAGESAAETIQVGLERAEAPHDERQG